MGRALTPTMFDAFQTGVLNPLLQKVQADDTLDLELRGNSANIYYRGGSLYRIDENLSATPFYSIYFDTRYCVTRQLREDPPLIAAPGMIPMYKQQMDEWFHLHPKLEREVQQWITRGNNRGSVANSSDYYIADIEYTDSKIPDARFDMVAVKWPSTRSAKMGEPLSLALIELKYGDGALTGKASIKKHLDDMENFIASPDWIPFVQDMQQVFQQKCKLGLLDGVGNKTVTIPVACPEKIFVFAEHDPESTILNRELTAITNVAQSCPSLRFATASAMGYGLYQNCMMSLDDFLANLKGK